SESQRRWLTDVLHADETYARSLFAFLAGLHDIGKATPTFQSKARPIYERLVDSGIPDERTYDVAHGVHSAVILTRLFTQQGTDKTIARQIASVVGGHHGAWIDFTMMRHHQSTAGGVVWQKLQDELFDSMRRAFGIDAVEPPQDEQQCQIFAVMLSGFISVCDWIGSHEGYFPYQAEPVDPDDYFSDSLVRAETALEQLGWYMWRPPRTRDDFHNLFGFAPNPMQQAAITAFESLAAPPRLILVEYLTGGGKTEIALYLTDLLVNLYGLGGAYVAMPTQATSNQMYERTSRFLQARYPDSQVDLQLAHAQADFHPLFAQFRQHIEREGNESGQTAEDWFHNRKRTLLAPFAVGTVDQAMLSVLEVKHHFVRLYALSHKVVVFDEIHSYDTYMNEIIERLMEWLAVMHTPTILLSATLPAADRLRLTQSFGAANEHLPDVQYPRLTIVSADGQLNVHPLPRPPSRTLYVQHVADDAAHWGDALTAAYAKGGCIAVICNTVDDAIRVYQYLRDHPAIDARDVILFHARFPTAWRGEIEREVLEAFGKDGHRPARAILVATQIIEQSLDLDFDLMLTQLAPVDLLIQRAGRLHRHSRQRPTHLAAPLLMIRAPALGHGAIPTFGVDEAIYARFILLKTWYALRDKTELRIPDDLDPLMNVVYDRSVQVDGAGDAFTQALDAALNDMTTRENGKAFRGSEYRIHAPFDESLIGSWTARMPDDDHNITTRDLRPGVDIVCMGNVPDGPLPLFVDRAPTHEEVSNLMRFKINVQKSEVVDGLRRLEPNPYWERTAGLRSARAVVFGNGDFAVPGTSIRLRLSRNNGLEYVEETP
ncbi:MAG: CRISPR-associated helicase Cas3', partial [Anaerolineae bacterium]|nr:CRISPR-associated helicase Cas3' [Anaerolineae bacterium]